MAIKKVLVGLEEEQLVDIDTYAEQMHISRSSAIRVLASQALEARKGMSTLEELMQAYKAELAKGAKAEG